MNSSIKFPDASALKMLEDRKTLFLCKFLSALRYLAFVFIIIALVRPQGLSYEVNSSSEGIDMILAMDASLSMQAQDFTPNRFEVAKVTAKEFIKNRTSDRIGLVIFGGEAYTQCPLTFDNKLLLSFLDKMEVGSVGDGTAIGTAIAVGLNRLKHSDAKSKVIILLTDGESNRGNITPLSAADLAKTMGVKIYTIGVGRKSGARVPYVDPVQGQRYLKNLDGTYYIPLVDEVTLREIAGKTGGSFFRAEDDQALVEVYKKIDNLEKTKINKATYRKYKDYFPVFLWIAFALLCTELLIGNTIFMRLP